jgi:hypothetical protein
MLEGLERRIIDSVVHRLANPLRIRAALADLSVSLAEALEAIDFLEASTAEAAVTLLDAPFRSYTNYKPRPTRFSDGSWPVFYSALEPETAEAERGHWCRKEVQSTPPVSWRFHYRRLQCRLNGSGYDVRPKSIDWPFLTGDNTYLPCQALAKEVKGVGASAMLCPSARRETGTTLPIFVREMLSEAEVLGVVILQIEPSGEITVIHPASPPR